MSTARRSTLVLVDGSNVARCRAWRARHPRADDADLRRTLVDAIASWAGAQGVEACVTFDGAGPWRAGATRITPDVEVVGSGAREGDDLIELRARAARDAGQAYWVVTSDNQLQLVAGAHAERTIGADAFVAELGVAPGDEPAGHHSEGLTQPGSTLAGSLDPEVRARLERLRRGHG